MGIMVYSLLWVMQDFVHQPKCYEDLESAPLYIPGNNATKALNLLHYIIKTYALLGLIYHSSMGGGVQGGSWSSNHKDANMGA